MFQNQTIIVVFCFLVTAKSTVGDVVIDERCEFTDHECLKNMYQILLKQTADGVPSLNIPRLDPMHLSNLVATHSLPNSFKMRMIEGTVTGLKNCIFDDVEIHHEENFRITYNMTCSIEVNAVNKIEIPKTLMGEFGGEAIADDVFSLNIKCRLTMEKYQLYLNLPFEFERKNDDIYLYVHALDIYHGADDMALAKFTIEDVDKDSKINSKIIEDYIQKNAAELNLMFPITEKVGEFLQAFEVGLISNMPAKKFFKDDLSSYIK